MATEAQRRIWEKRAELRDELCGVYKYFTHETPRANLKSIRETGLEPRDPGCSSDDALITELGVTKRDMVCLHPVGSCGGLHSTQGGPFVLLAIKEVAVPAEVTLDWSFPGCWGLAAVLGEAETSESQIFLEVVRRRGSVSAIGGISPGNLYVLCKAAQDGDPEIWCRLEEAHDDDIVVYATAGQPPSVPQCPLESPAE